MRKSVVTLLSLILIAAVPSASGAVFGTAPDAAPAAASAVQPSATPELTPSTAPEPDPTSATTPVSREPAKTPDDPATVKDPESLGTITQDPRAANKAKPDVAPKSMSAAAADARKKLFVIGDSTTAWFSDVVGSPSRGWWSLLAQDLKMEPVLSAENSSGMWAKGNKCHGTTFTSRLRELDALVARVGADQIGAIIVAGGRNDHHGCLANGTYRGIKRASTERAIRNYMTALSGKVKKLGISPSKVYVTTIWGDSLRSVHRYVWPAQEREAKRQGFTYARIRFLDRKDTIDTAHPNLSGNDKIRWRIRAASITASNNIMSQR